MQGRLFAYGDAHRYRVGANHNLLPINRPKAEVNNYQRDGFMRVMTMGKALSTMSQIALVDQQKIQKDKSHLLKYLD